MKFHVFRLFTGMIIHKFFAYTMCYKPAKFWVFFQSCSFYEWLFIFNFWCYSVISYVVWGAMQTNLSSLENTLRQLLYQLNYVSLWLNYSFNHPFHFDFKLCVRETIIK